MALTRADAKQSTAQQKPYVLKVLATLAAVQKLLDETSSDIHDAVMRSSSGGTVNNESQLVSDIKALLAIYFAAMNEVTDAGVKAVITVRVNQAVEQVLPVLRVAGANNEANSFSAQINNYPQQAVSRYHAMQTGPYNLSYDDRTAALALSAVKVSQALIQYGQDKGQSASDISLNLARYINPTPTQQAQRPWSAIRQRFQYVDNAIPADVMAGSFQTNVYDLERTISGDMYRQATDEFYADKPWAEGFDWVLSATHEIEDVCDDNEAANPYGPDDAQPDSHNFCLCDWVVRVMSIDDIAALVDGGDLS